MFAELLESITQLIQQHPTWSGSLVFLVAMVESLAIIGFIVPGVAIMFAIGALISQGSLDLISTVIWAAAGASTGDALSFFLGYHYKERLYQLGWFKRHQHLLDDGHRFFEKYGVYSVLIGRFIGPIRAIIPLVAGILGMPIKHYIPVNIVASALWAPAYLVPGLFFGSAFSIIPVTLQNEWLLIALAIVVILILYKVVTKHS